MYLEKYEKMKYESCVANIEDKTKSLRYESFVEKPNKEYILEKAKSILHDIQCIISLCERKED